MPSDNFIGGYAPRINQHGALEFSVPGAATSTGTITRWERGLQMHTHKGSRQLATPFWTLRLFGGPDTAGLPRSIAGFLEEVPAEFRQAVAPYAFGQCIMLRHIATLPAARDLALGNPRLLWMLSTAPFDAVIGPEDIPGLLKRRQPDILRAIGAARRKAALKTVARAALRAGSLQEWRDLVGTVSDVRLLKSVAHLPSLPTALLSVLVRYPILARAGLARILVRPAIEMTPDLPRIAGDLVRTVRDILRLAERLGIERLDRSLNRCRSISDVERMQRRWMRQLNRRLLEAADEEIRHRDDTLAARPAFLLPRQQVDDEQPGWRPAGTLVEFPEPPFPGTPDIRPIRNSHQLALEKALMHNCLLEYQPKVVAGLVSIYRVLNPNRATVEICKTENGWAIGELKMVCNKEVPNACRQAVMNWFDSVT